MVAEDITRTKRSRMPRNLYYLTQDYLKERKAIITLNNISKEKEITRRCPQGSCCGLELWNIQFDLVLKIKYKKHTKEVAFADDLLIFVRADSVGEAENIANVELNKITKWARDNKLRFNDRKSKVMLLTRRKRKEKKRCMYVYMYVCVYVCMFICMYVCVCVCM